MHFVVDSLYQGTEDNGNMQTNEIPSASEQHDLRFFVLHTRRGFRCNAFRCKAGMQCILHHLPCLDQSCSPALPQARKYGLD